MSRRQQKRRQRSAAGGHRTYNGKHGPLEFKPPAIAVQMAQTGAFCTAWRRGRSGGQHYTVEFLPILLSDPAVEFVVAPAHAMRLALAERRNPKAAVDFMYLGEGQIQKILSEYPHDVVLHTNLGNGRARQVVA